MAQQAEAGEIVTHPPHIAPSAQKRPYKREERKRYANKHARQKRRRAQIRALVRNEVTGPPSECRLGQGCEIISRLRLVVSWFDKTCNRSPLLALSLAVRTHHEKTRNGTKY